MPRFRGAFLFAHGLPTIQKSSKHGLCSEPVIYILKYSKKRANAYVWLVDYAFACVSSFIRLTFTIVYMMAAIARTASNIQPSM